MSRSELLKTEDFDPSPDFVGAKPTKEGVFFRLWAPKRSKTAVVHRPPEGRPVEHPLAPQGDGYFAALVPSMKAGDLYQFRVDDEPDGFPDPASRFQPNGPHGPSEVVDLESYPWTDGGWKGIAVEKQVVYEMHVGTLTAEGTWAAAEATLDQLAELGVTTLEVMPVADFVGEFGWGYDGVNLFASTRLYGRPEEFQRFVDAAHERGLSVVLDVVYNHLGPDGNYLRKYADHYFSRRHHTDWGDAINFDDEHSKPVRSYFLYNVEHWVRLFHVDGLRLDATQNIYDDGEPHVLREIGERARAAGAGRRIYIVGENESQDVRLLHSVDDGGFGLDALWNDDFHHSAMVCLTRRREAYYTDYFGTPQEFLTAAKRGFLYQGQYYAWQKQRRGSSTRGLDASNFINFLQNHDQVANSGLGFRVHHITSPGKNRALTTLMLLMPARRCCFKARNSRRVRRSCISPTTIPKSANSSVGGAKPSWRSFPASFRKRPGPRWPTPATATPSTARN